MQLADPDLRHRGALGLAGHFRAQFRLAIDLDLLEGHPLAGQQLLGPAAIGAPIAGIDDHGDHVYFTTGRLSARQPLMPPDSLAAVKPAFFSSRQIEPACWPMASTTISVLSLCLSSSARRLMTFSWGMFSAPTIWPVAKSLLLRTSSTRPCSLLSNAVSSRLLRLCPPLRISVKISKASSAAKITASR